MISSVLNVKGSKRSRSVRASVYQNLKERILAGHFHPGERLAEEHLAKNLGVSRTPVREALHKLESEGLITPLETRGFCVSHDSSEEMEDLFDIRAALEGYAIRLICQSITEETIERLNGIIDRAEKAFERKRLDEIFRLNTQFHDTLNEVVSYRKRFYKLIADTRKYVLRYRKDSLHYLEGARRTIVGHRKILMAISMRDPDLCERVMRAHVEEARLQALNKILEEGDTA